MFTMASFPHNYLEHVKQSDRKTTAVIRGTPIYDTPYIYIYKGAHIDRSLQGSYVYGPYWIYLRRLSQKDRTQIRADRDTLAHSHIETATPLAKRPYTNPRGPGYPRTFSP